MSAPPKGTLLELTQQWDSIAGLDDLRSRSVERDFIEIRFWQGFGLVGTAGVLVRRERGQWRAWQLRVTDCHIAVPLAVGDTLSPTTIRAYQDTALVECTRPRSVPNAIRGVRILGASRVAMIPVEPIRSLDSTWGRVDGLGILRLPPTVRRDGLMMDGHTYVMELRVGDVYRASAIEKWEPPQGPADRRIQLIAAVIDSAFAVNRARN